MPYFRSLGVNVPVVLCANKADAAAQGQPGSSDVVHDEILPVMAEFKEIDCYIRTSAREHFNINEAFYLCQKAVTHPIAPLYDSKESALKPAAVSALRRIFYLCDKDQDGLLNDAELQAFQLKAFEKPLGDEDLANIKTTLGRWSSNTKDPTVHDSHSATDGLDIDDFLLLHKLFAEKGRHETVWIILRKFNYTDSLTLHDSFLHPKFDVPPHASAELSPAGYKFFVDLFVSHDKNNDGGLDDAELAAAFAPTPGLPQAWLDAGFPSCTVCNEAGYVTLQGWLAQWSMTTFENPKVTLEYLAHLGFEPPSTGKKPYYSQSAGGVATTSALKFTKARKRRPGRATAGPHNKTDRNVFFAYVVGGPGAGKTSLLTAFLNRPYSSIHAPTLSPRVAVNSVELESGKQCYLILSELGSLHSSSVLSNAARLDAADLICYAYDGSDQDSFAHLIQLRQQHARLIDNVPAVFAALKADKDRVVQRSEVQPDVYTEALRLGSKPLHISAMWAHSVQDFCVHLAECAADPGSSLPSPAQAKGRTGGDENDASWWGTGDGAGRMGLYMAVGAALCGVTAFVIVWRRGLD